MPAVVTKASTVSCAHEGTVTTLGSAKLTVGGSPVLVESGIAGEPIAGCKIPPNPPADTNTVCTSVLTVDASSLATKLSVGGNPVALASLSGTTNGVLSSEAPPTPLTGLNAEVTQTLLTRI